MDAYTLLTPLRMDLIPKLLYASYREAGLYTDYAENLYKEHLRLWNNFSEYDNPEKNTYEAFKGSFDTLLDSMRDKGFDSQYPVPVTPEGLLLNGAHRTAAAFVHSKEVPTVVSTDPQAGQVDCSLSFFQNLGMDGSSCDSLVSEYAKLRGDTRIITLHPARDTQKDSEVLELITNTVPIIAQKGIPFSKKAYGLFMSQMYFGEPWVGNFRGCEGAKIKADQCWGENLATILVVQGLPTEEMDDLKQKIRDIYNIDKSSVHINDTHAETVRLIRILFNQNSLHFLENADPFKYETFLQKCLIYLRTIVDNNQNGEFFALTGSAPLGLYGLRCPSDLDYLHYDSTMVIDGDPYISSHEQELARYPVTPLTSFHPPSARKDDYLFNPNNYFYWNDMKVISLNAVIKMKQYRNEPKDRNDLGLIQSLVDG